MNFEYAVFYLIGLIPAVYGQGPGFTVKYMPTFIDPWRNPLKLSCDTYYGQSIMSSFYHTEGTLNLSCGPQVSVYVARDIKVTVAGYKLNYTATLNLTMVGPPTFSPEPPTVLDQCLNTVQSSYQHIPSLDSISGVNFEKIPEKGECPYLILDPYKIPMESVVYDPGKESPSTPSSGPSTTTLPAPWTTIFPTTNGSKKLSQFIISSIILIFIHLIFFN